MSDLTAEAVAALRALVAAIELESAHVDTSHADIVALLEGHAALTAKRVLEKAEMAGVSGR